MSKDTGGPAFPSHGTMGEVVQSGMTLREYFAVHASDADIEELKQFVGYVRKVEIDGFSGHRSVTNHLPENWRSIARFMHADAMLAERAK